MRLNGLSTDLEFLPGFDHPQTTAVRISVMNLRHVLSSSLIFPFMDYLFFLLV